MYLKHHVGMYSLIKTVEFKAEDFPSKGKNVSEKQDQFWKKKLVVRGTLVTSYKRTTNVPRSTDSRNWSALSTNKVTNHLAFFTGV